MSLGLRSPRTILLFHLGLPDPLGRGILVPLTLTLDFVAPFLVGGLDSSGEAGWEGQSSERESSQACDDIAEEAVRTGTVVASRLSCIHEVLADSWRSRIAIAVRCCRRPSPCNVKLWAGCCRGRSRSVAVVGSDRSMLDNGGMD